MIRDSPGAALGGRNVVHQPLLLYHEYLQDKDRHREFLGVSNMNILLFIKFYDPKTECLKVSHVCTGSKAASCHG